MEETEGRELDLTIVMPCLNEEAAVGYCVDDALEFMKKYHLQGEVLVVDNASDDNSQETAKDHGARVILEPRRGYGRALRTGFEHARGKVIIMGDCDTTYDFQNLQPMYEPLANGNCDMVIGNRYAGGIEKGAMPFSHRWGVRFLSYCGRKRFKVAVYDFHCGIRGFTRPAYQKLELQTDGMEFATELIAEAAKNGLSIQEIPVTLKKCRLKRKSKLNTVKDGLRHLRYIISE